MALSVASAGASANGHSADARSEHQRVIDFWTHERVAQAIPRDFIFDPATGRFDPVAKPDNPGNGNDGGNGGGPGGGGEDSSVVTGASWNGGGDVDGAVGKVLFRMGSSYYICSATLIDDEAAGSNGSALILTAAHCVYDESANGSPLGFADMWMFVPDYDSSPASLTASGSFCADTTYGCWSADAMVVHDGYATAGGFNEAAITYDYAVVRVGPGGHGETELDHTDGAIVEQDVSFTASANGDDGYAFGYPAERKWKGNDLIYCAGPIDLDPHNSLDTTYRINECKLNGGSSGGGWMINFSTTTGSGELISVNSYGYGGINAMHGPFLNDGAEAVYNEAKSGGNDFVSS